MCYLHAPAPQGSCDHYGPQACTENSLSRIPGMPLRRATGARGCRAGAVSSRGQPGSRAALELLWPQVFVLAAPAWSHQPQRGRGSPASSEEAHGQGFCVSPVAPHPEDQSELLLTHASEG